MGNKSNTYYLRLKVLSPIHIGCDEVYEPTGFAIDEKKKELISFEPASFLGRLAQKDLDSYSAICKKGTVSSLLEIYKFIRLHKEHAEGRRVAVSDAFINHYNKTMKLGTGAVQQQLNKFQVGRTAFQRLSGTPYIPGSAIKGAIRTAVLNFRNNGKRQLSFRGKTAGRELQEHLLNYNGRQMETDPFRLIKVGDFKAIRDVSQRVVYCVNKKKKLSKKEASGPYQILEVIKEGSEFVGTVTVQQPSQAAGIKQSVTFAEIQQALTGFYNREQQNGQQTLQNIGCNGAAFPDASLSVPLIRIGRHSGAECVTVEGYREIKIMSGPGVKPKYEKHASTLWLAAESNKSTTNKFLKPFGWATLSLLLEEEIRQFEKERADNFNVWEKDQQEAIIVFKEKAKLFAVRREEEELEKKRLAEELWRKEEELRNFPWRVILPKLKQISDWGILKTQILEHENFKQYQSEGEVGQAVMETADRVAEKNPKKWDADRDQLVAEWLKPSAVKWVNKIPLDNDAINNPLLEKIQGFSTPADYDRNLDIPGLDAKCCSFLIPLFRQWGWDKKKKARANNHKLWKDLQRRRKQLKQ